MPLFLDAEKYVIGTRNVGFFSNFFGVINNLVWCDKKELVPVVYWDKVSCYFIDNGYNGSKNVWEYYFEPVSDLCYAEEEKIRRIYTAPDGFKIPWCACNYKKNFDLKFREKISNIIKKYIKIKQSILNKIDCFFKKNIAGKTTVGIHVRGTDKYKEVRPVKLSNVIDIANTFSNCQFFVASDEQKIIDRLKRELNGKVISYDAWRTLNNVPIHYSKEKQCNKAKCGEDVLIEVALLSICDIFIHSHSNVSTAVLFFNPKLPHIFLDPQNFSNTKNNMFFRKIFFLCKSMFNF